MKKLTTEQFIERAKQIHLDKYDYSLVNYTGAKDKIKIICKEHGEFEQTAHSHINKIKNRNRTSGCPKCFWKNYTLSTEQFIERAKQIHFDLYDYHLVNYINIHTKVKIICKEHGEFFQTPNKHIVQKHGCPKCKSSKGELTFLRYFKKYNINFIPQKRFPDCKDKLPLPFDFYLPEVNTCIEYDGIQHFTGYRFYSKDINIKKLQQTQHHDQIKNNYCKANNIRLIRVPYTIKLTEEYLNNMMPTFRAKAPIN